MIFRHRKHFILILIFCVIALLIIGGIAFAMMFKFPGKSFSGQLPPLTDSQRQISSALKRDVEHLASEIGERNFLRHEELRAAADYIEESFRKAGYDLIGRQGYQFREKTCENLEVGIRGKTKPEEIVIIGAHYDSVVGCPGANDNGSGVAALLALAREFANRKTFRTLRFVAFVNEEPPAFPGEQMGSAVYAKRCRERKENITSMISLETLGYYSDKPKSQSYPAPFSLLYPSTGNFIAFVGNSASKGLVTQAIASFRNHARFPSETGAFPESIPGIGWSDHASFWREGYPALMVTDTAPFRYPHYHTENDTPDKVMYDHLARVVEGLSAVVDDLANQ